MLPRHHRVRLIYARPSEEAAARADFNDACQLSAAWTTLHAESAARTVPSAAVPMAADSTDTEDVSGIDCCAADTVVASEDSLQLTSVMDEG